MSIKRILILLTVKLFFSLIALLILTIVIHEGAHYITAVILGVPIQSFTLFDPHYFAPIFVSGATEYTWEVMVVSYAGGLVTGLLLLAILVFKRNWFKQSLYRWFLGFYIATFASWQLSNGILEGAFHEMYSSGATSIFSLSSCIGLASALLGMIVYYWLFVPGLNALIAKGKYS